MNEILQTLNAEKAYNLIAEKLDSWMQTAIQLLPNFVVAVIVLIVFWFSAKLIKKLTERIMHRFSDNKGLISLMSATLYIAVMAIGTFVALSILQLDKAVTSLLAGAGIIGLALGFAFQDIASNFVAGILMATRKPFRVGDILDTNEHFGTVTEMNLRATIIKDFQGQEIIIPNKEVYQKPIKNYSRYSKRRIDLAVGISYGENLQKVKDVVLEAINSIDMVDKSKPVDFAYNGFGDSSINFDIYYWVSQPNQMNYNMAVSAGVMAIKKAFDENDITIPFPIRTLDFGIKGGEKFHQSVNQIEFLKTINSNQNPKN
ncbi:mechanosensitive ion channel family protein [Halocola ammonii]